VEFTWDPNKALANRRKHGVSFEEALTVFGDPLARIHEDLPHSATDQREIVIGRSTADRLLLVSFVERADSVRIISARQAARSERQAYEEALD